MSFGCVFQCRPPNHGDAGACKRYKQLREFRFEHPLGKIASSAWSFQAQFQCFNGGSAGYSFGPAKWFGAYIHTVSGIDPVFAFGGTESYPNDRDYVVPTSTQSNHSETDQVLLPPVIAGALH